MNKVLVTEDGSHTIYNPELDETYHSIHGAIQESNHVYIEHGLRFYAYWLPPYLYTGSRYALLWSPMVPRSGDM